MKKMEKEMENVFETKVKEKKQKLKDSEHELTQKHKNVSFTTPSLSQPFWAIFKTSTRWFKIERLSESDDFFYRAAQTIHIIRSGQLIACWKA